MSKMGYFDELERALARSDYDLMCAQIDAYADCIVNRDGKWPQEYVEDFGELISCYHENPDKAMAYIIIGSSRSDDARFLALLGCGPLEDLLRDPSAELLERIIAEARKSARFRWLLSNPFKVAIAPRAWEAIKCFRITGSHEEPSGDTLPPRY